MRALLSSSLVLHHHRSIQTLSSNSEHAPQRRLQAFKCYGLDGAQHGKEWDEIRGPCVILRGEPPTTVDQRTGATERLQYEYK